MGHSHQDDTPLGIVDVIVGLVAFAGLAWIATTVAGPEGVGFLKNLLNAERSQEFVYSGVLFLFVWYFLSVVVVEPYLAAFYERESKTSLLKEKNLSIRKEIDQLKREIDSELRTARLEGIKRRDEKVVEAKNLGSEIVEEGQKVSEKEWGRVSKELDSLRSSLMGSIESEVGDISSSLYRKIVPGSTSDGVLHFFLFAVLAFSPSLAVAAGGGHGDADISTLQYPTYNFILYLLLMTFVYKKIVRPILRDYRAEVESVVVRSQNEFATLDREIEQIKSRLDNISEEKSALVSELEQEGRNLAADVLSSANEKAESLLGDVAIRAESERQKIGYEAKKALIGKAFDTVRERLATTYSDADDKSLIQTSLSSTLRELR